MGRIKQFFHSIYKSIDIKSDVCLISGLSMLGYGLWLYEPWVSFSVCGALLVIAGLRLGGE